MDEIEDAVAAGVHAGDQVGPGDRALGRNAGGELAERSFARELGKIRHFALLHELAEQLRIHAINAENDELVRIRALARDQESDAEECGEQPERSSQRPAPFGMDAAIVTKAELVSVASEFS